MTTDPRLEALVNKVIRSRWDILTNRMHLTEEELRSILAEAMEAGAWVTCPECEGRGTLVGKGGDPVAVKCLTCLGTGNIRRELAGALWAIQNYPAYPTTSPDETDAAIVTEAREKWGAKQEAKP